MMPPRSSEARPRIPDGFSSIACHGLAAVCTSAAMCLTDPRATVERRSASVIDAHGRPQDFAETDEPQGPRTPPTRTPVSNSNWLQRPRLTVDIVGLWRPVRGWATPARGSCLNWVMEACRPPLSSAPRELTAGLGAPDASISGWLARFTSFRLRDLPGERLLAGGAVPISPFSRQ